MKEPNSELVTKQRTFSIDQSIESGMPRTYSVDSVDYTTMLMGDMEEEEKDSEDEDMEEDEEGDMEDEEEDDMEEEEGDEDME